MGLVVYYFVSALLMCLALTIAIHVDKDHQIEEMCKKERVSLKAFIVVCTLLGFITLPYAVFNYFKSSFEE